MNIPAPTMSSRDWLSTLVAIDTTSRNSNLGLIETVRDALARLGVPGTLSHSPDGRKANLFATLPAQNGETQGGIVLSGHTDVVPVDGQQWDSDPFILTERDGKWYGRGTADMKGFIATALALVPQFLQMPRLKPLHLAFSYDEEVGCLGAPVMIRELLQRGQRIDGCVVGEPTAMQVVVAHKGINLFECQVHGKAAHSSLTPNGCNAIEYAAMLICHIREIADTMRKNGPYDHAFDVPFTTMTTNKIAGGIALNTIADLCEFSYEFRNLPGLRPQELQSQVERYVAEVLLPRMREEDPKARVELRAGPASPALEASEQSAITGLARALQGDNEIRKVAFGTEAGLFQQAGIPSIVCGPGDIQHAHKANEHVEISQIQACEHFLLRLGQSLQTGLPDRP